jgi:Carboxypeptidase regulatory-like domain
MAALRPSFAQLASPKSPGAIEGTVADPTGAVIPQATVTAARPGTAAISVTSDGMGHFSLPSLPPGTYNVQAQAAGFRALAKQGIHVAPGVIQHVTLTLAIETDQQQVVVTDSALDTSPGSNGSSITMKGDDLRALSDDPSEMQTELEAIAGADAETGAQLYVDGFSGGRMPPKSAIREIRINQNPYSAQYDSLGFGRIEVFTKPGADKLHGDYWMQGNNSPWNAPNPFVRSQPPYHSYMFDGDLNGPLTKNASIFAGIFRQDAVNDAVINAVILDPANNPINYSQAIASTASTLEFSPRFDLQWGKVQTLSLRYQLERTTSTNAGVGQFELASQGYSSTNTEQILQFSDAQAYGAKLLNETRFQYIRDRNKQTPVSTDPTLAVQGAFTGGGNNVGINRDNQDHYEFQDYLHISRGPHDWNLGARVRGIRDANYSTANFNGQYTFASLAAYQATVQGQAAGLSPAQIRAAGGGASLFSQTEGVPNIAVTLADLGLYAEDDWKLKEDMTFSYGLRYETQTGIHDHADFGPRLGFSWAVPGGKNKPPRAVIRAGSGFFYTRFASTGLLQAQRQNGIMERAVVVSNPDFYPTTCSADPGACAAAQQNAPTIYRIHPTLRAPYLITAGIGVDKAMGKLGNISANYMYSRGEHLFLTRNINAPLPGTFDPADPSSGVRPLGINENIYEYQSEGASARQRLLINGGLRGKKVGLFMRYQFSKISANTAGLTTFPSDQYDLHRDYGRAAFDIRHRVYFGGFTRLPGGFNLNPFIAWQSSTPFNLVLGEDLNGDTQFNDRPAFATDLSRPSVVHTQWGVFDTQPMAGQKIIPVNYANGPGFIVTNLRLMKRFNFGPKLPDPAAAAPPKDAKTPPPPPSAPGAKPAKPEKKEIERRYTWGIGIGSENILNHRNLAQPVGVLGSPLFGQSTALHNAWGESGSANRTVNLETFFRF